MQGAGKFMAHKASLIVIVFSMPLFVITGAQAAPPPQYGGVLMIIDTAEGAVQRFLADVGIQMELEFPDGGAYTTIKFKDGWRNGFCTNHTRMLATFNITYNYYWQTIASSFISMKRPDGLLQKLDASLRTLAPEDAKGQELTRMTADDAMFIPIYYVYEMYVVQPNVHDTGYCEWSASTVYTPETAWLSK